MGDTHEQKNKKYLAELIAEEIAKRVLKVNIYGYDLWRGYEIIIKEPTPYKEWPYVVCTPFEIGLLSDLGSEAREVVIISEGVEYKLAWDPGRKDDDTWYPKNIPAGSTFYLENKKIAKLYIHALTTGTLYIDAEGFTDC